MKNINCVCILSIVLITMNRSRQVVEALESCADCKLPQGTEFIIIDNASVDDTQSVIEKFIKKHNDLNVIYEKMSINLGAGEGRNRGFKLSSGKYLYFLDDDAVINKRYANVFFLKLIQIMETDKQIASATTQVYDEAINGYRVPRLSKKKSKEEYSLRQCLSGGSSIIRKDVFEQYFYPDIAYGYEEMYPSFFAFEKGYYNIDVDEIEIIHKPQIDKWSRESQYYEETMIKGVAGQLSVKYLLYPIIMRPILFTSFFIRYLLYLRKYKGSFKKSYQLFRKQTKNVISPKIKITTVIRLFEHFGFGAII